MDSAKSGSIVIEPESVAACSVEVEEIDIRDVKKGDRLYFIADTGDDE